MVRTPELTALVVTDLPWAFPLIPVLPSVLRTIRAYEAKVQQITDDALAEGWTRNGIVRVLPMVAVTRSDPKVLNGIMDSLRRMAEGLETRLQPYLKPA